MGRLPKIYSSFYPYHVFGRSNNKEWFSVEPQICWDIFSDRINQTIEKYRLDIHVFVLMINHYHLLLSTPNENIGEAMRFLLTQISKDINKASGRINHVFGGRYKSTLIQSEKDYFNVFKYVLRNPVEAKVAKTVESYLFSTIHETLGNRSRVSICRNKNGFDSLVSDNTGELLMWLNNDFEGNFSNQIEKALFRSIFKLKGKNGR